MVLVTGTGLKIATYPDRPTSRIVVAPGPCSCMDATGTVIVAAQRLPRQPETAVFGKTSFKRTWHATREPSENSGGWVTAHLSSGSASANATRRCVDGSQDGSKLASTSSPTRFSLENPRLRADRRKVLPLHCRRFRATSCDRGTGWRTHNWFRARGSMRGMPRG